MIDEHWKVFAEAIFAGKPVARVQHDEMRKAFFAGATAMLRMMQAVGDDSVSEEQGVMVLDAVEQECVEFSKNLMAEFAKRN
jgi:hypothetical protein